MGKLSEIKGKRVYFDANTLFITLLKWLYPFLGDLDENPLYLRLTRQRFGRKPARFRRIEIQELDIARQPFATAGRLPLLLLTFSVIGSFLCIGIPAVFSISPVKNKLAWVLLDAGARIMVITFLPSAIIVIWRAVGLSAEVYYSRFLRNARDEAWGEEIYLTRLNGLDYDRALFVGILLRIIWSGLRAAFYVMFGLTAFVALYAAIVNTPGLMASMWFTSMLYTCPTIAYMLAYGFFVGGYQLAVRFDTARHNNKIPYVTAFWNGAALRWTLIHVPCAVVIVIAINKLDESQGAFKLSSYLVFLRGLTLATVVPAYLATRFHWWNNQGGTGIALRAAIQEKYGN